MEYEQLFADSDIEEDDSYSCRLHHLQSANDYVIPYIPTSVVNSSDYGLTNNCHSHKMSQKRQEKLTNRVKTVSSRTDTVQYLNGCQKKFNLKKDTLSKFERRYAKPKYNKITSDTRSNSFNIAGPSRLIDRPVDYRLDFFFK